MAKKKVAKAPRPKAKVTKRRAAPGDPVITGTNPATVSFTAGSPFSFEVLGSNFYDTKKVPPTSPDKTLTLLWEQSGQYSYTFPEGSVSVFDGNSTKFIVRGMWPRVKQKGLSGSGTLTITVMTGRPTSKKAKGTSPATVN
jgi:hypothetical protein